MATGEAIRPAAHPGPFSFLTPTPRSEYYHMGSVVCGYGVVGTRQTMPSKWNTLRTYVQYFAVETVSGERRPVIPS